MDGRKCLVELKKDEKLKNIPVIIFSTSGNKINDKLTKELNADQFLAKLSNIFSFPEELTIKKNKAFEN